MRRRARRAGGRAGPSAPLRGGAAQSHRAPDPVDGDLHEKAREQPARELPRANPGGRALEGAGNGPGQLSAVAPVAAAHPRRRTGGGILPRLSVDGAARRGRGSLDTAIRRRTQGRPLPAPCPGRLLVDVPGGAQAGPPPARGGLRDPGPAEPGAGRAHGSQAMGRTGHRRTAGREPGPRRGLRLSQGMGVGAGGCGLQGHRPRLVDAAGTPARQDPPALILRKEGRRCGTRHRRAQPREPGAVPVPVGSRRRGGERGGVAATGRVQDAPGAFPRPMDRARPGQDAGDARLLAPARPGDPGDEHPGAAATHRHRRHPRGRPRRRPGRDAGAAA